MTNKTDWNDLPQGVRDAVREQAGGIAAVRTISAGWNSEASLVAETGSGPLFVKGARLADTLKVVQLRREISINPYVTHLSPEIRFHVEAGGWLVAAFNFVNGRRADYSPCSPDIPRVFEALDALSHTPRPDVELKYADQVYSSQGDVALLRRVSGDSLVHGDLTPANVLVTPERVFLLDWARPTRGASWLDAVSMAHFMITCGHSPRDAEAIAAQLRGWKDLGPGDLDAIVHHGSAVRSAWGLKPHATDPWTNASLEAARRWWSHRRAL
ncbi:Phosphotransferase enzyme family protein [Actinomadura rubteroloni]|uniref:Phosphotransferase enzyme family protein n=1 Tax=Actinomadura rubteroloni TaxID=1926885 RepID=A0A2P4UHX9_9ACTN|nr:phosphotransferase [Actinomadura rubteroloni]POM24675.1 Phosphotransferase enzyme family protein [Actinomadura rubteroloni]